MEYRKRNCSLRLRLDEKELKMLKERLSYCKETNTNRYLRNMALNGCIIHVDHGDIRRMNYELNRIGNNLNQIAHKVNETDSIYRNEIEMMKELMDQIWQLLRSNLSEEL